MGIFEALQELRKGKGIRLPQWEKDTIIRMQFLDGDNGTTDLCIYTSNIGGNASNFSVRDMLSKKWEVVE